MIIYLYTSDEAEDIPAVCKRYKQANCKNAKSIIRGTLGLEVWRFHTDTDTDNTSRGELVRKTDTV